MLLLNIPLQVLHSGHSDWVTRVEHIAGERLAAQSILRASLQAVLKAARRHAAVISQRSLPALISLPSQMWAWCLPA